MKFKRFKNYITWKNKKGEFNTECNRASLENDLSLTIPTSDLTKVAINTGGGIENMSNLRIRKLVPLECLKLMAFTETDYQAMREIGMSDSQLYNCAGNSIITTCLMAIFGELLQTDYVKSIEEYVRGLVNERKTFY